MLNLGDEAFIDKVFKTGMWEISDSCILCEWVGSLMLILIKAVTWIGKLKK